MNHFLGISSDVDSVKSRTVPTDLRGSRRRRCNPDKLQLIFDKRIPRTTKTKFARAGSPNT